MGCALCLFIYVAHKTLNFSALPLNKIPWAAPINKVFFIQYLLEIVVAVEITL